MKIFNFPCYAVLSIDTCDDDPENEPDSPKLRGFWASEAAANLAIDAMRADRIAVNTRSDEAFRARFPWSTAPTPRSTILYVVIAYDHVNSHDLWHLEEDLETVAALRAKAQLA